MILVVNLLHFVHLIHFDDQVIVNLIAYDWRIQLIEKCLNATYITLYLHAIVSASYFDAIYTICY